MILRGKVGVGGWLGRDQPKNLYACMQNPWTQAIVWWRPGYICLCFSINSIILKYFTGDMSICHGYSTVKLRQRFRHSPKWSNAFISLRNNIKSMHLCMLLATSILERSRRTAWKSVALFKPLAKSRTVLANRIHGGLGNTDWSIKRTYCRKIKTMS